MPGAQRDGLPPKRRGRCQKKSAENNKVNSIFCIVMKHSEDYPIDVEDESPMKRGTTRRLQTLHRCSLDPEQDEKFRSRYQRLLEENLPVAKRMRTSASHAEIALEGDELRHLQRKGVLLRNDCEEMRDYRRTRFVRKHNH
eukprot:GHVU01123814.1.p1 GENE.GHVU01123814.1~~GHVU01123814.1.p1  ORF type:complete len:141 (-),score=15.26 GHVU01123814.1:431-853(-)